MRTRFGPLVLLAFAVPLHAQLRVVEAPVPLSPTLAVAPLAAAAAALPAPLLTRGLGAPLLLTPAPRVVGARWSLAGLRSRVGALASSSWLRPELDRFFDLRAMAAPAAEEPWAVPVFRHFDHADFLEDGPFPGDDNGNPLIVPEQLKPLLPSAFDKATWSGRTTLHLHSHFSDGTMTPEEVVEAAFKAGVRSVALTDHDTLVGVRRAWKKAKELGMDFHPGAELSARGGIHIGAIDVDPFNPDLLAAMERMHQLRWKKASVILGNLNNLPELKQKGIVLTMAEVEAKSKHAEGGTIEIPHIARVLVERKLIERVDDAYNTYLKGDAFKGIEKYADPIVDDVLAVIRKAGGKAILNHPYTLREVRTDDGVEVAPRDFADSRRQDELIEAVLAKGVDGIEVYRPIGARSEEGKKRADARAAKYLLWVDKYSVGGKVLIAAPGSDYHGTDTHLNRLAVWMPKPLAAQAQDALREANAAAIASLEAHERAEPPSAARPASLVRVVPHPVAWGKLALIGLAVLLAFLLVR